MWTTSEVCRISAALVSGLLAAVLLRTNRRDSSAIASVFLLAGVAAHLALPLLLRRGAAALAVHSALLLSITVPLAFWLLAQAHFDDAFRLRRAHWSIASAYLVIAYVAWLATVEHRLPGALFVPGHDRFWALLPKLLALAIVLHALMRVYAGAGADLVLPRLRARFAVLLTSGSYILIELLGEAFFADSDAAAIAEAAHNVAVLGLMLLVSFLSLRMAPDMFPGPRAAAEDPALDPVLAERLQRLIEAGEIFRQEGLTIRHLAEALGAQEYKVRQLINSRLGFKNFNAFLNRFRVTAAERLLADAGQAHLGVAEIAYQVGYRSLATFNRAFKELNGCTPSEYRASRQP